MNLSHFFTVLILLCSCHKDRNVTLRPFYPTSQLSSGPSRFSRIPDWPASLTTKKEEKILLFMVQASKDRSTIRNIE